MFKKTWGVIVVVFKWMKRYKYLVVSLIFFVIIFFVSKNGMMGRFANQRKKSELKEEIAQLRRDSARVVLLQSQLENNGNIDEIEKMARDKFDMHKKNEDVFYILEE